ncbi:MAG: DNA polymerase III subunit alpha [Paracoccaceae bacterium]|nr:DNA polymerase III subunit alpha [Paracoccaceae bacterium]
MSSPRFIHLRVHSEYSLLEGAVRLKALPKLCAANGMPAVALTDTNNMFAALEFSVTALDAGIQPIVGCQVDLAFDPAREGANPNPPAPLVLLAQNRAGYENLMALNSALYLGAGGARAEVTLDTLTAHAGGLICLTGGPDGPLGRLIASGRQTQAAALLDRLAAAFGDRLYVELQRHPTEGAAPEAERTTEAATVALAYQKALPLVATNDVYFPEPSMYEAHDALICIAEGAYVDQQAPRRRLTPQHYFKSPAEMAALFADLPEATLNTIEIARRCAFAVSRHDPILPKFAENEVEELRKQARDGLTARLAAIEPAAPLAEYEARLDYELGVIEGMGFPGYFLIVADFIKWAKDQSIPVGPGRGSGAGSLVAYALTITDLDPLRYGLLFERFLNPERVSMPDFDIDFCMDRREEVIAYVQEKYGRDRVGQIITFGALLSKAAVRDIGRVLQMPYGQVDRLSKLIPIEGVKPVSIEKALADEPRLREEAKAEEVVDRLLTYGAQVEGLLRNASTHAAGVVIGDRALDKLVPLYQDPRSDMPATQFNMKWVEQAGLVKFDFLGLKTLTVIQNALDLLAERGVELDINAIPLDDEKTYELYSAAKTVAVFQVESSGMMDALVRMKPTSIEDIVALVALYRPGPMENIPKYCDVKNDRAERESIHPLIDPILDETQGIIVYQEQVMEIARKMAGYSLGGADLLRRAMGKKIQAAMDAERPKFLAGAKDNGVDEKKALEVWNLLDKFANYGFNKSHAAAYAVVSYQTAWLKANHPVEFMAGVMNCDLHLTDKLAVYAEEVRRGLGIEIVPPCVNRSEAMFSVADGRIVYALGALKNVGVEAMRLIVEARRQARPAPAAEQGPRATGRDGPHEAPDQVQGGATPDKPFATLFDFARRVDLRRIGKRPLEMLSRAGAFDELDPNRARVFQSLDALTAYSAAIHDQRASAQVSLFGEAGDDLPEPRLSPAEDWLASDRLEAEHEAVGFYLSGHPLDDYLAALKRKGCTTLAELRDKAERDGGAVGRVGVMVSGLQDRKSGRGTRFFRMTISDPTLTVPGMALFPEDFEASRRVFEQGLRVVMTLEARFNDGGFDPVARSVTPLDTVAADAGDMAVRVFIDAPEGAVSVRSLLDRYREDAAVRGRGEVRIAPLGLPVGEVDIELGDGWPMTPEIRSALKSLPGVAAVEDVA